MNNEDVDEVKRQMVSKLKEGIESSMQEDFVDRYDEWKAKFKSVNAVISHVDSTVPLYTYNEFCKKVIEITKESLNKIVDYEKLFLTSSEYLKIMNENSDDEEKMEKVMLEELNRKFIDNLIMVLSENQLKESVRYKLKEKFFIIEEELEKSLGIAKSILKKHEEKK
jgi:L-rhamnose mutarotase